jgi:hypothetical protein
LLERCRSPLDCLMAKAQNLPVTPHKWYFFKNLFFCRQFELYMSRSTGLMSIRSMYICSKVGSWQPSDRKGSSICHLQRIVNKSMI